MHSEAHELAGQTVTIKSGDFEGEPYRIEDWWDRVSGGRSWMDMEGNPACLEYAIRSADERKPMSNDVVYGKVHGFGKLMHISDLGEPVE